MTEVATLWNRLEAMERERRFDGRSYPDGMCSFPFRLTGQGFFPGGDGLWRQDDALGSPSTGQIRRNGVMWLGNDFGTLRSYAKLQAKGYENPPTWRHLKERIARAGLSPSMSFCTNAVMGLRAAGTALEAMRGADAVALRNAWDIATESGVTYSAR